MLAASILGRDEEERRNLLLSFATSLAVHALGMVLWLLLATAMITLNQRLQTEALEEARRRLQEDRTPTLFVEVSPEQVVAEAPENTPYYSVANTRAANPDPAQAEDPKIDGSQSFMVKTFDVLQPQPELLLPTPPPEVVQRVERLPEPALNQPSDLTVVPDTPPQPAPPRTRTLVEARLRQGIQVGPKMDQSGGVRRRGAISLDTKASPFGAYDAALIAAVQKRWYDLIDSSAVAPRPGRVIVEFTLHYDGRVTDARVVEQEVGEIRALYCRKAITDPAPFAPWPQEMRTIMARDYREVRFTFHYF
jgi:outer membrane biosynthesis protein TonB